MVMSQMGGGINGPQGNWLRMFEKIPVLLPGRTPHTWAIRLEVAQQTKRWRNAHSIGTQLRAFALRLEVGFERTEVGDQSRQFAIWDRSSPHRVDNSEN